MTSAGSIEFDPEPARQLARLSEPLRQHLATELRRLLRSPGTESTRPGEFYPPGRKFEVQTSYEGMDVFIDIIFKCSADEITLIITYVNIEIA